MSFIPDSFHLTCSAIHPPPWHIPQPLHLWSQFHLCSGTQSTSLARMSESHRSSVPGIILCPTKSQFPMVPRGTNWGQWRFFSEYRKESFFWLVLSISRLHLLHHRMPSSGIMVFSGELPEPEEFNLISCYQPAGMPGPWFPHMYKGNMLWYPEQASNNTKGALNPTRRKGSQKWLESPPVARKQIFFRFQMNRWNILRKSALGPGTPLGVFRKLNNW